MSGAEPNAGLVYIVDDDDDLLAALGDYLQRHGFQVSTAVGGVELETLLNAGKPDLIVLDVMMPGEDGLSICRRLSTAGLPVLLLSALGETTDRIIGLEIGASDYLAKPFEPRELLARARAVLRRPRSDAPSEPLGKAIRFGAWRLEPEEHQLWRPDGARVTLTTGEARLLGALASRPGRLFARDTLLGQVRGPDAEAFDRSIDLLVSRLRRKLAGHGLPDVIETVRGEGYRFVQPEGGR